MENLDDVLKQLEGVLETGREDQESKITKYLNDFNEKYGVDALERQLNEDVKKAGVEYNKKKENWQKAQEEMEKLIEKMGKSYQVEWATVECYKLPRSKNRDKN